MIEHRTRKAINSKTIANELGVKILLNLMPKKTTIEQIEKALRATGGFISQAARKLKVSQSAVSQRIKRDTYLQEVMEEISEEYLDISESQLMKKVKDGDAASIFFHLKCKGKHRGYIEKQQLEHSGNIPITVITNIPRSPVDR